jgi:calcineurin-like phosphoesterase family protein
MKGLIKWWHFSDFHIGRDILAQEKMFSHITALVTSYRSAGKHPDFIFITGDISNSGKDVEFQSFEKFIFQLYDSLAGLETKILAVPGNHDLDRHQAQPTIKHGLLDKFPKALDPNDDGRKLREHLFPRFSGYTKADIPELGGKWIDSAAGFAFKIELVTDIRVGVVGLNTAWLSENDRDRNELTPGFRIVERALDAIAACDLKIVLGHHPLGWLIDSEAQKISSVLSKAKAIYLHGHLHDNSASINLDAGRQLVAIQAGSAFQLRDNLHTNRVLWGEYNHALQTIDLIPHEWNELLSEWKIDSNAFPNEFQKGTDSIWTIPRQLPPKPISTPAPPQMPTLIGWQHLTSDELRKRSTPLPTKEEILQFYDGRIPDWRIIASPDVPKRKIARRIIDDLSQSPEPKITRIILISGPGGEGKSTVFLQAIHGLVTAQASHETLWHANTETPLIATHLASLPRTGKRWLIATDDADLIAQDIFELAKLLKAANRDDFDFLITCRDSDWLASKADTLPWNSCSQFTERKLRGLEIDDARLVVNAWAEYGEKGLGNLHRIPHETAAHKLVEEAHREAASDEGAFLGAMLRLRKGSEMDSHVKSLLERLAARKISKESTATLLDAFIYIAAIHATGLKILSPVILSRMLDIEPSDVRKKVMRPLGEEAAATMAGDHLMTRHRAIAEAAVKLAPDLYGYELGEIYTEACTIAEQAFGDGQFVPDLGDWRYRMPTHFFDKGEALLAVRIAKALSANSPLDPFLIVNCSKLYRRCSQPEFSLKLFAETSPRITKIRALYTEWGAAQMACDNDALSAVLIGISLSDQSAMSWPDRRDIELSLPILDACFNNLSDRFAGNDFASAVRAVTQLRELATNSNYTGPPSDSLVDLVERGVHLAHERIESELPDWVPQTSSLKFENLKGLFRSISQLNLSK